MGQEGTVESGVFWVTQRERRVKIEVVPSILRSTVSLRVDSVEVARIPKPTGEHPWTEHPIPGLDRSVFVGLLAEADRPMVASVFVDRRSLLDGESVEAWRGRAPRPMDRFEQAWRTLAFLDRWARVAFAGLIAVAGVPFLLAAPDGQRLPGAFAVLFVGLVAYAYSAGVGVLVRWLMTRPQWPVPLRSAIVWAAMLGLPLLLVVVASSA
jgi:hypothetical protein